MSGEGRRPPDRTGPVARPDLKIVARAGSSALSLEDITLAPREGDVEKLVAVPMHDGRIHLKVYDRLSAPLIVADLGRSEVEALIRILARVIG